MTVSQFILRLGYTNERPPEIHPLRWAAMLKWFETRKRLGENYDRLYIPRYE
jgi:hypothetical protein